ncbi:MAG TPA: sigma-70 family RNA polymerase sigma factor [Methylomirabilota bacterium]|nr:sigma-70 family RNA polymerase sigma factor [Methylomirabilota bacterium]
MNFQCLENPGLVLHANVATRASLLRRVCDWSDDASWQEFFDLYWRILYAVAIQSGLTESEAEEAVQATMISVAKKIRDFEYDPQIGSFRRWICNQAQWKVTDFLRRRARERNHLQEPRVIGSSTSTRTATVAGIPDEHNALEDFLEKDWARAIVHVALAEVKAVVPPKQFQMFDLHVVKKWPMRDVARLLQVSMPQVYLAKSRVSRLLRQKTRKVEAQLERLPSVVNHSKKKL